MPCETSCQTLIMYLLMIFGLTIVCISSENYTTQIKSIVYCCFWHISHYRCTCMFNQSTTQTHKITEYTAKWPHMICVWICRMNMLLEQWLYPLLVHLAISIRPICLASSPASLSIPQMVMIEKLSSPHLKWISQFILHWLPNPCQVDTLQPRYCIPQFKLCCPHSRLLW